MEFTIPDKIQRKLVELAAAPGTPNWNALETLVPGR